MPQSPLLVVSLVGILGGSVSFGDVIPNPKNTARYFDGYGHKFVGGAVVFRYDHAVDLQHDLTILVVTAYPVPLPSGSDGALADEQVVAVRMSRKNADREGIRAGSVVDVEGRVERFRVKSDAGNVEDRQSIYYVRAHEVRRKEGGVVPTQEFLGLVKAVANRAGTRKPLGYGLLFLVPALTLWPVSPYS
ncbi:MAG: hypothetical protein V1656_03545 [Candidatus Jorgensenbacteria bacterium]